MFVDAPDVVRAEDAVAVAGGRHGDEQIRPRLDIKKRALKVVRFSLKHLPHLVMGDRVQRGGVGDAPLLIAFVPIVLRAICCFP